MLAWSLGRQVRINLGQKLVVVLVEETIRKKPPSGAPAEPVGVKVGRLAVGGKRPRESL